MTDDTYLKPFNPLSAWDLNMIFLKKQMKMERFI